MAGAHGAARRARGMLVAALATASLAFAGEARAQGGRLDRYPAPSGPGDLLWLERAAPPLRSERPFARLAVELADDPLVLSSPGGANPQSRIVDEQLGIHLSAGLRVAERIDLALLVPVLVQSSELPVPGAAPLARSATGDPGLDLRVVLLDARAPLEVAIGATLRAPVGDVAALAADDGPSYSARLLVSRAFWQHGSWAGLSLGLSIRPERALVDLELGPELVAVLGVQLGLSSWLGFTAELAGSSVLGGGFAEETSPLEGTLGFRFELPAGVVLSAGVGAGLDAGYGAPDARGVVVAAFGEPPSSRASAEPAVGPGPDRDGDGVPDADDACPAAAEDRDGREDDDGCPDLDGDHDGVADARDGCPGEAEDLDGFEDDDGCPDPDDDGDGIADVSDRCPRVPEDLDGFEDDNGCPDLDDDQDGVADVVDACRLEPESINGHEDADGCPDFVRVDGDRLRLLEPVRFAANGERILASSLPMLREVAALLRARPDLGRVSIEAHTDSLGSSGHDRRLSGRRARSVVELLVRAGVRAERLEWRGLGDARREGTAGWRSPRVEMVLLDLASPGSGATVEPGR